MNGIKVKMREEVEKSNSMWFLLRSSIGSQQMYFPHQTRTIIIPPDMYHSNKQENT